MKPPYFPFTGEASKPQMGLQSLSLENWVEIDSQFLPHTRLKSELIQNHGPIVLQTLPGSEDASFELYEVLQNHLLQFHASHFKRTADRFQVLVSGREFVRPSSARECFEQISQWTQEDWCLLSAKAPVRLEAGMVCFPSRWALADKMGKDSDGIHGPVPKFKETIAKPTMNFLERVSVDKSMWRTNWTIHDSDQLFCPGPHPGRTGLNEHNVLRSVFLRVERQTLRRLPKTGAVVFSIRTYLDPLESVLSDPQRVRRAHETLQELPLEAAEYKGMKAFFAPLKTALQGLVDDSPL